MAGNAATPLRRTITAPAVAMPAGAGAVAGNGLAQIGDQLQDFGGHLAKAQDQSDLVAARLSASRQLDDLHQKYLTDSDPSTAPDRFAKDASAIGDQMQADGAFHSSLASDAFREDFGNLMEARRASIMETSYVRMKSEAVANMDNSVETFTRQAAAAPLGSPERKVALDQIGNGIDGLTHTGLLSAADGQKMQQKALEALALYDGKAAILTDPSKAARALQDPNYLSNLDPLNRITLRNEADAEVKQRAREARAQAAEARTAASLALSDLHTVIASGLPASQDQINEATGAAAAAGDPRSQHTLLGLLKANDFVIAMRGATPQQVQGDLASKDAEAGAHGASPALAAEYSAAQHFLSNMTTGLRDDPLMWGAKQGVVQIAPLKLDGSDSPQAWRARVAAAQQTATRYGMPPVYLTKAEQDGLKGALDPAQPAAARLHTAQALAAGLGPRALSVFAQIAPHDPVMADAGALMLKGNTTAAHDALAGQTLLRGAGDGKVSDLTPSPAGRNALPVTVQLRQAVDGTSPGASDRVLATANALYAARAARQGLTGADIGKGSAAARELWQRSLNEAVGGRYWGPVQFGGLSTYRGVPVVAPDGIPAINFEDAVHGLSDRALTTHSVTGAPPLWDGKPVTQGDLANLFVISRGDGLYGLSTTDPRVAITPIEDAGGAPYKFSLLDAYAHTGAPPGKPK